MDIEFEKYKALLEAIMPILDEHFELQKDYIKCKVGCSTCCQKGYYPVTTAEAKLMIEGFKNLPEQLREEIIQKAEKLARERETFMAQGNEITAFKYACPFLVRDKCSVYEHRPIICRTQGLILQSIRNEQAFNMPACVYIGLNYSNVWDENINFFSQEKVKTLGYEVPPVALDFSYESLLEMCGVNPDTLLDNLINSENDEIRMIFEWVLSENLNKC